MPNPFTHDLVPSQAPRKTTFHMLEFCKWMTEILGSGRTNNPSVRAPANCSKRNARRRSSRTTSSYASPRKTIHCSVQSTSASGVVCWKWGTYLVLFWWAFMTCTGRKKFMGIVPPKERQKDRSLKTKIECGCGMNNDLECQKQSTLILTLNEVGDSVRERTRSGSPRMKSMKQ